jgi:transposase
MQASPSLVRVRRQDALPLVDQFLARLDLRQQLTAHIPHPHYRDALELLVKNVLLCPSALYRVPAWAQSYDPALLPAGPLGDDALGRALDRLFAADRASLQTALILQAVQRFKLQSEQIHNDSTSVKFSGAYEHQNAQAIQLRRGHSKDHRPDLKQLIYSLSISADGAVPVHFKTYAGNQADETTHWETWQSLSRLLERSDFLYVAGSKLCVKQTLLQIHQAQGRFITMMPRTRGEGTAFAQAAANQQVRWEPLWQRRALRKSHCRECFELAAGPRQSAEGFALHWYRSSEKRQRDLRDRQQRLQAAQRRLERLNERRGRGPKTEPAVRRAAENILARYHVASLLEYEIELQDKVQQTQQTLGHPGTQVRRPRVIKPVPVLSVRQRSKALEQAQTMDGTFPLLTNTSLLPLEVVQKYKYQPRLEKRHSLGKSVLEISPVFLKNNTRIEALMFIYFIAQLVASLMERTLRQNMAREAIDALPTLPESRSSKTPTYAQIVDAFTNRAKTELYENGQCTDRFTEPLSQPQQLLLRLLGLDPSIYS